MPSPILYPSRLLRDKTSAGDEDLIAALIAALNSGKRAEMEAFVGHWCDSSVPVAERASRLENLARQGAPFRLIRRLPDQPGRLRAVVEDKNGEQIGLMVEVTSGAGPRLKRIMVAPPEALDAPPPKNYTGWKSLQALTDAIRTDTGCPAMALAVIRDGRLEQAVSGTRLVGGGASVGVDEPWSIGSIGKPICGTVIGRLIETGKLRWETTLGDALRSVPMKPGYRDVTLVQLLHHRGGIPADLGFRRPDIERIVGTATDRVKMRENYARDLLGRDPAGKPGERFEYSNGGYALLGIIAERVSGIPYEHLVRTLVFAPLSLRHSFTGKDRLPTDRPSGHFRQKDKLEPANFTGPLEILFAPAGGGLFMSAADLARFGQTHLDGLLGKDGILRSATIHRLHEGLPEQPGGGRLYACGWGIERLDNGDEMHTHNGSNGTMRAQVALLPARRLVIAAFVNAGGETEPSPPLQAILAVAAASAKKAG